MTSFDIFDTIERLRAEGRPFCVATVLRAAGITAAKAGCKAAITDTGEIIGHLGGGCVQGAARKAAVEALSSGEPGIIRVKPSETVVSLEDDDGVRLYKSGCPSGGTVDILLEPYRRPPMVVIFGKTPIARAVARHAAMLGYDIAATVDPDGIAGQYRLIENADLSELGLSAGDFVIVATQGEGDLAALRAAIESPADYVGMVASRRKAEFLKQKLAESGMAPERLARLVSPAGLDLGGVDPGEIAISILSEIVRRRHAGSIENGLISVES
ncbi:XdhC family protein [Rhizobiales bacterium]|uniref:XdhC family protein n=1 Tax=Hongsoonwoonella zoysiae TaxID=2821844 RepID=UPI001561204B|nr:XdhC family protein [Hongsoonwoonella zoysiae]NRG18728.1 XdhC family protein [Hongsoonwoonella zoysiae]